MRIFKTFNGKTIQLIFIPLIISLTMKKLTGDSAFQFSHGGIIRAGSSEKTLALIFTGGDFADGGELIRNILQRKNIQASFFFTGDFYRKPEFKFIISGLLRDGHYLGPHSNQHLLYCSWEKRDSLLVTKQEFREDLLANLTEMEKFGIDKSEVSYFLPPYEWYNDSISVWSKELGMLLINFTPGTIANADYTIPGMRNYRSTETIYDNIINYEQKNPNGLNGFLLLLHIGTDAERTDKFYYRLEELIDYLLQKGYSFKRIDDLLKNK